MAISIKLPEDSQVRCGKCGEPLGPHNVSRLQNDEIVHIGCPKRTWNEVAATTSKAQPTAPPPTVETAPQEPPKKKRGRPRKVKDEAPVPEKLFPPGGEHFFADRPAPVVPFEKYGSSSPVSALSSRDGAAQDLRAPAPPGGGEIVTGGIILPSGKPDFEIPMPAIVGLAAAMPIDEAIEVACRKLKLPILGGPSRRGWSHLSTAIVCPQLFKQTYDCEGADGHERTFPAEPLQVGGLYHALQAFYYGYGLGGGGVLLRERGLLAPELLHRGQRYGMYTLAMADADLPPDAADQLLHELKAMAEDIEPALQASVDGEQQAPKRPWMPIILAAEKAFDAHVNHWGSGNEDVIPLAVEWLAKNPLTGYTCRYDMIAKIGSNDPLLPPNAIVAFERKTAKYRGDASEFGWPLDGEVLGEIMLWKASGCEQLFGPLAGVCVDVVTKQTKAECFRIFIPADNRAVEKHAKWSRYYQAQIDTWRSTGQYPMNLTSCIQRDGSLCGEFQNCAKGGG